MILQDAHPPVQHATHFDERIDTPSQSMCSPPRQSMAVIVDLMCRGQMRDITYVDERTKHPHRRTVAQCGCIWLRSAPLPSTYSHETRSTTHHTRASITKRSWSSPPMMPACPNDAQPGQILVVKRVQALTLETCRQLLTFTAALARGCHDARLWYHRNTSYEHSQ
jgi:hypothetical protein